MARPNGKEQFDTIWKPLVGVGLVLAFGVQSALPYVSPLLIVLLAVVMGIFYHMSYSNIVNNREVSPKYQFIGISMGLSIIVLIVFGIIQAGIALEEIRPQCERLRKELLQVPDSTKSDTYTALKCPNYTKFATPLFTLPETPSSNGNL